jgi:heme/copper-type cytochrome/quinol oxidase subunit 3
MSDATAQETDVYAETPELHERIDRVGFSLLGGATVMFFLGFVFAYFYLRSLDNSELWRPPGVSPPTGYGIVIAASLALSAVAFGYAAMVVRRGGRGWVAPSGVALVLGLIEYANLDFGPKSGGFASVFFGWTALYTVATLIALWRVETAFALGIRHRGEAEKAPVGFVPAAIYWALLAGIGILAWIILYLV